MTEYSYGHTVKTCPECGQDFDLDDPIEAEEWYYGHDCEAS